MGLWCCFLARLLFYAAMLPLWEGYDEWAHFAVVRQMAFGGRWLPSRDAAIPRDVETSLQLAPVPWELRSLAPPAVTRDDYWRLSREERERRKAQLGSPPDAWGLKAYEALQPPLYYWLMTPMLWICRWLGVGLLGQVLALRFLSALLASFIVPLVYRIGLEVWDDNRVALGTAAIAALMPGLAIDVARVGNDCLAVLLFTLLTCLLLRTRRTAPAGLVMGLGLLTKAYFLTAIPAVLLVRRWTWRARFTTVAIGVVIAGWWYARNVWTTGTLSGLSESVTLRGESPGQMFHQAIGINWAKAVDAILLSHLYFGGWSSLTVRSWMYHLFYLAVLAGALGLMRVVRQPAIRTLLAVYLCFWLGQIYNVVLLYMSKGLAGSMGWYMYAVVGAEVTLCVAGLRSLAPAHMSRWVAALGAAMFAVLDLYTVHGVAIPYYTGMIHHRAGGSLEALHGAALRSVGIAGAVERLAVFVPPLVLVGLWVLYVAGTAGAFVCACARKCDDAAKNQG